ncbi:hypothetical protein DPMN_189224 [Dreissena polymorpha]|uniref:Uncharacterized protein n=1 Tax=Dreissena polymorpha TaxID=45954 RepID=A0A9D4DT57_DREPO|nr:hypothetical protein DPMN_189224 [Dreissena polymorpha]
MIMKINRKSKPERNSFDREMATWERHPKNDDHDITGERRNDFNSRHYRSSQENFASPTYMYPYNSHTESISIKPGSSLSNLTFPEYKFEISRPKLVLGRNGRY